MTRRHGGRAKKAPIYPASTSTRAFVATCEAHDGRKLYPSRKVARRKIKQLEYGQDMRAYQCDVSPAGLWHIGHLPPAVREGRKTAGEVYRGKGGP